MKETAYFTLVLCCRMIVLSVTALYRYKIMNCIVFIAHNF